MITVNVFNIYNGHSMSVAIPWENYPVLETDRFRRWAVKTYPCYDIKNKYMGYMNNGEFYDMRECYYCAVCCFETDNFWRAVVHGIKHFLSIRKRKMTIPDKK